MEDFLFYTSAFCVCLPLCIIARELNEFNKSFRGIAPILPCRRPGEETSEEVGEKK